MFRFKLKNKGIAMPGLLTLPLLEMGSRGDFFRDWLRFDRYQGCYCFLAVGHMFLETWCGQQFPCCDWSVPS